ncbi:MAG: hypothetical protein K2J95_04635 [Lachnospiraceae bacterium]|nr:hypothetical protein [Lachnospiraceae bacterium]
MVTGITGSGQQIYGWNQQVTGKNKDQNETAALENGRKQGTDRTVEEKKEFQEKLLKQIKGEKHAPYDYLATDGCINYNGVTFFCDMEKNQLCLGIVSDPHKCLMVSLENGGTLMVNQDCIGDLGRAITMFTPEDQKRIMYAVSMYKKAKELEQEIEDDTASIGDSAEATMDEKSGDIEVDGVADINAEKQEKYK